MFFIIIVTTFTCIGFELSRESSGDILSWIATLGAVALGSVSVLCPQCWAGQKEHEGVWGDSSVGESTYRVG